VSTPPWFENEGKREKKGGQRMSKGVEEEKEEEVIISLDAGGESGQR